MAQPIVNGPRSVTATSSVPANVGPVAPVSGSTRFERDLRRCQIATAAMAALIMSGRGSNLDAACGDAVKWADMLMEKLG